MSPLSVISGFIAVIFFVTLIMLLVVVIFHSVPVTNLKSQLLVLVEAEAKVMLLKGLSFFALLTSLLRTILFALLSLSNLVIFVTSFEVLPFPTVPVSNLKSGLIVVEAEAKLMFLKGCFFFVLLTSLLGAILFAVLLLSN